MAKSYCSHLVGAFGDPVDENPTGTMKEAAFAAKGLNYRYLTIEIREDGLKAAMQAVRALNMRGINLTVPHKVSVLEYLDDLSPAAQIIGAVNTVVNKDGRLWGDNTDGKGFILALKEKGAEVAGKTMTVLGAGGAARAIAVECALAGTRRVVIVNKNRQRGEILAELIGQKTNAASEFIHWEPKIAIPEYTDILVNATTVGHYPNVNEKPDIDYDSISDKVVVADVIFNDPHSHFLKTAERRGCRTINGLGMLVHQGALNFHLWTGVEPPRELMMDTLRREFNLDPEGAS